MEVTSARADELRAALQTAIEQSPPDYARVLALSTELAKLDPDNVRFFADAGLISRLGRELVSRKETALAELVKNAYDADATSVGMVFENANDTGGILEIVDNGTGMTRKDLVEGFMRLSSNIKVREPVSPRYRRQRAGRKGIGRFAVQRLGLRVIITTQTLDAPRALRVVIDWSRFEGGQDLSSIASRIEEVDKERDEGTVLVIEGLRDRWTDAAVRRAYRYVSDLLQPFPLTARTERSDTDPGFRVNVFRPVDGELKPVADEESEFLNYAQAVIEGVVDEEGRGYWSIKSNQFPEVDEPIVPIGSDPKDPVQTFLHLRNVRLRVYYYIPQAGLLPRSLDKTIRKFLQERGGVRVYRNGFRVLPYGEEGDDWLGFDSAQARRLILVPLSNRNVYGFVELFDPEGEAFEETASREGLIENAAFRELQEFAYRVVRAAVLRVNSARDVKRLASGRHDQEERPPQARIREAVRRLRESPSSDEEEGRREADDIADDIASGLDELERSRQALLDELGMVRVLASLGIVIGEFTHEIRQLIPGAVLGARYLDTELRGSPLEETAADLHQNVRQFRTYAAYFDQTVRENVSRDLASQELGALVEGFALVIKPALSRTGTRLEIDVEGTDLYTTPMHPSEWASVLFNLHSNAQKAIKRARSTGRIAIRVARSAGRVFLEFADNGDGVPPEYAERIFSPFFTTSTPSGGPFDGDEDLQGSGLGLKILRDITESYGGDVSLVDPPPGFATCFRIEVPEATDQEVEETY